MASQQLIDACGFRRMEKVRGRGSRNREPQLPIVERTLAQNGRELDSNPALSLTNWVSLSQPLSSPGFYILSYKMRGLNLEMA